MVTNDNGSVQNETLDPKGASERAKATDEGSVSRPPGYDDGGVSRPNFESLESDETAITNVGNVKTGNVSPKQTTEFSYAEDEGRVTLLGKIDTGSVTGFSAISTEAKAFEEIVIDSGGVKGPTFTLTYLTSTFAFTTDESSVTESTALADLSTTAITDDQGGVTDTEGDSITSSVESVTTEETPITEQEVDPTTVQSQTTANDRGSVQTSLDFVNALPAKGFFDVPTSGIETFTDDEGSVGTPNNIAPGEALEVEVVTLTARAGKLAVDTGSVTTESVDQSPSFIEGLTTGQGSKTVATGSSTEISSVAIAEDRGSIQTPPGFVRGLITAAGSDTVLGRTFSFTSDSGSVTTLITQDNGSVVSGVLSVTAANDVATVSVDSVTSVESAVIDPTSNLFADDTGSVSQAFVASKPLAGIQIDSTKEWNKNAVKNATYAKDSKVYIPWLRYKSYNIDTLLNLQGLPESTTDMGTYFDKSSSGVTKLDEGLYPITNIAFEAQTKSTLPTTATSPPSEIRDLSEYSYKITGRLKAPVDGDYIFGISNTDSADVLIDGSIVVSNYDSGSASDTYTTDSIVSLTAGWHSIEVRYVSESYDAIALGWKKPFDSNVSVIQLGRFGVTASKRVLTRDFGQGGYTPDIKLMEYSEDGGELLLNITGSPGTTDTETKTRGLAGERKRNLSWNRSHQEFDIEVVFNNNGLNTTATFDRIIFSAENVVNGTVTQSTTNTKTSTTFSRANDTGSLLKLYASYFPKTKRTDEGKLSISQVVTLPEEFQVVWETEEDWDTDLTSKENVIHRDKFRYDSDNLRVSYPNEEPGLDLYCNFDEPAGSTTVTDLSGNETNGTVVNAQVSQDGVTGTTAIEFDGEQNTYVDFGSDPGVFFSQQSQWAVSVWIYPTDLRTENSTFGVQNTVMARADPDTPSNFVFGVSEDGYVQVYVRTFSGTVFGQFEQIQIPENEWSHISLNQVNNKLICRINGNDGGSDNNFGDPLYFPSSTKFTVGIELRDNVGFTGLIDEPRVFTTGLSIGRQASQYNVTQQGRVISETKEL